MQAIKLSIVALAAGLFCSQATPAQARPGLTARIGRSVARTAKRSWRRLTIRRRERRAFERLLATNPAAKQRYQAELARLGHKGLKRRRKMERISTGVNVALGLGLASIWAPLGLVNMSATASSALFAVEFTRGVKVARQEAQLRTIAKLRAQKTPLNSALIKLQRRNQISPRGRRRAAARERHLEQLRKKGSFAASWVPK